MNNLENKITHMQVSQTHANRTSVLIYIIIYTPKASKHVLNIIFNLFGSEQQVGRALKRGKLRDKTALINIQS